jgi:hypothetical protein
LISILSYGIPLFFFKELAHRFVQMRVRIYFAEHSVGCNHRASRIARSLHLPR